MGRPDFITVATLIAGSISSWFMKSACLLWRTLRSLPHGGCSSQPSIRAGPGEVITAPLTPHSLGERETTCTLFSGRHKNLAGYIFVSFHNGNAQVLWSYWTGSPSPEVKCDHLVQSWPRNADTSSASSKRAPRAAIACRNQECSPSP